MASEEVQNPLRSLAIAAGRYGFSSNLDEKGLDIRAWEVLIASTGNNSRIKIFIDNNNIVIENMGLVTLRRIRVPIDRPGRAVAIAYYAWLDRNRSLESRMARAFVKIGRTAKPREGCDKMFEHVLGMKYEFGSCSRLAALLAYEAYIARVFFGVDPGDLLGNGFFPDTREAGDMGDYLASFASLARTMSQVYENLDHVLSEGARVFDKYRYLPVVLKTSLDLASYLDRLPVSWRVYLAGLNLAEAPVRMALRCRGPGLTDAAVLGESAWLRSGDGSVVCQASHRAAHGLALTHYTRAGGRVGVVALSERTVNKCLSYRDASCSSLSVVLDPGEVALRRAASCVSVGECGAKIVYYEERPVVLVADYSGVGAGELVLARLPGRRISMVDAAMPDRVAKLVRGEPSRGLSAEALSSFSRALRYLKSGRATQP